MLIELKAFVEVFVNCVVTEFLVNVKVEIWHPSAQDPNPRCNIYPSRLWWRKMRRKLSRVNVGAGPGWG
jgi:hypothetical protein